MLDKEKAALILKKERTNQGLKQEFVIEDLKEKLGGKGISLKTLQRMEKGSPDVSEEKYIEMLHYYDIPHTEEGVKTLYEDNDFYNLLKEEGILEAAIEIDEKLSVQALKLIRELLNDLLMEAQNYEEPYLGEVQQVEKHITLIDMKIRASELQGKFLENNIILFFNKRDSYRIVESYSNKEPLKLEGISERELYFFKKDSPRVKQTKTGVNYITVENYNYKSFFKERERISKKYKFNSVDDLLMTFPNLRIKSEESITKEKGTEGIKKKEIEQQKMNVFKEIFKNFYYENERQKHHHDIFFIGEDPDAEENKYSCPEDWEEDFYRWYKK
ncbi:helix-turn-helix domain-containing protein [Ilyobacter polytropus]|uniref:HTH cro/C1-type domain-containing protein n=1 Tax=Ilyobacter polytropus (strain ATCC 51220 / DSM 2926 / LMG 16218 / CuHBu1) TaxID=572544 RepID=E3H8C3_ILYPC|nr:helix-turn-helix transcriptional regulator [Ilyobacter polytropus]ADO82690.1 hypothetical protein Ilyop_0905 [Ilyobacter polytropus DSM 2926]